MGKRKNMHKIGDLKVTEDKQAKTTSYSCIEGNTMVSIKEIDSLVKESKKRHRTDSRLCLHKDPKDDFHQMVIVQFKGKNRKIHKHPRKEEAYQMIYGRMAIIVFSEEKEAEQVIILDKDNFLFRMKKNGWHVNLPLTDYVIFSETSRGPYIPDKDNIIARWTPNDKEYLNYYRSILDGI